MSSGYATREYAATCAHMGAPRMLARSGVSMLVRGIEAPFAASDACGAYPLLATDRWQELAEDLAAESALVSFVAVVDPLSAPGRDLLEDVFPHQLLAFKTHHVARLDAHKPLAHVLLAHRRKARRAAQAFTIEVADDAAALAPDWLRLYRGLRERHGFGGAADFPDAALRAQLSLPGMTIVLARSGARVVSMSLWFVAGEHAHYHLGASDAGGYAANASFGTFALALETLAARGVAVVDLGGGAGDSDTAGGLARFKSGWASETRTAWLGGRVLDRATYERLGGGGRAHEYFPAYRLRVAA